ncbi:hypothetical protein Tfer_1271 [Thermincola ferriacetica]|uniref:DUF2179 domain-containing protein n=1 Tax=Thermincola ferriacetica TaxID=281456 RepID=A0A0L6W4V5_9FIRM|nr:YitT family protein [Thermincola ferriacetica]KNZ70129.1 hypothetical protein Tfer_1271 [Thermincola ferriacetica]
MTAKVVRDYIGITVGVVIMALGLDMFLVPNKIAAGGVSGIATLLYYLFRVPVGMAMLLINVPLFLTAIKTLGFGFGVRSLYGTIALSVAVDLLAPYVPVPTHQPLLASIYGGIAVGIGLGLVFRYKATTGGTDLAAAIVNKYLVWASVGLILFGIDAMVIIAAGYVFNAELALYALLTVFLTARVIDVVQEGFGSAKAALIISDNAEEIGQAILEKLDRGATALHGTGFYTGTDKKVILSVVTRAEISGLKELVHQIDPRAFVILTDVHEVLGEGFKGSIA